MRLIVVKIGSSSLTSDEGGLNRERIGFFADEITSLIRSGAHVLLVTSGAVAAGFRAIGYTTRPKALHEKQAAAAVGQALLMQAYNQAFGLHNIPTAQILLTRYDFSNRRSVHNAQMTIDELLRRGVVPIINENDTVSVDELKFGDNDTLSALVANLCKAQQLDIITDTDGLYTADPRHHSDARRLDRIDAVTDEIFRIAGGAGSSVGTGGMRSKVEAARIAMRGGVPVFIGRVTEPGDLRAAVAGTGKGTYFETRQHSLSMKKQWLGFHSLPKGTVLVDSGAEAALRSGGKSLLPVGICEVEGDFHPGDVIEVINGERYPIGRGVSNYTSAQIRAVAGLSTDEVQKRVDVQRIEVIHRDEWVTLN
ncbi:glutamate 5-kinase [Paenibacillus swuensis]